MYRIMPYVSVQYPYNYVYAACEGWIWMSPMYNNEKVNQGSLYDINVLFNRLLETKLHPIIVRQ